MPSLPKFVSGFIGFTDSREIEIPQLLEALENSDWHVRSGQSGFVTEGGPG